jgi:hypothetical protein
MAIKQSRRNLNRGFISFTTYNDDTYAEEQYAPRHKNPFNYIGHDIQLKIECNGADENIVIYPPKIGYKPLKLREGGKRHSNITMRFY